MIFREACPIFTFKNACVKKCTKMCPKKFQMFHLSNFVCAELFLKRRGLRDFLSPRRSKNERTRDVVQFLPLKCSRKRKKFWTVLLHFSFKTGAPGPQKRGPKMTPMYHNVPEKVPNVPLPKPALNAVPGVQKSPRMCPKVPSRMCPKIIFGQTRALAMPEPTFDQQ